jgi:hypothetical protein
MPDQHANRPTAPQTQRQSRRSKDGQWRSFPKAPNVLQYLGSGTYYARTKLRGKTIRRSLDTDVLTIAKLRLLDFLREEREKRTDVNFPTFAQAQERYEQQLDTDPAIKPQSRQCRRWCIHKLELSWPALRTLRLDETKLEACREWAAKVSQEIACHDYNNSIATLRAFFPVFSHLPRPGPQRTMQ